MRGSCVAALHHDRDQRGRTCTVTPMCHRPGLLHGRLDWARRLRHTDEAPTHRVDANGKRSRTQLDSQGKALDLMFTPPRAPLSCAKTTARGNSPGPVGRTRKSLLRSVRRAAPILGAEQSRCRGRTKMPAMLRCPVSVDGGGRARKFALQANRVSLALGMALGRARNRPSRASRASRTRAWAESLRFAFGLGKMPRGQMGRDKRVDTDDAPFATIPNVGFCRAETVSPRSVHSQKSWRLPPRASPAQKQCSFAAVKRVEMCTACRSPPRLSPLASRHPPQKWLPVGHQVQTSLAPTFMPRPNARPTLVLGSMPDWRAG
jgi:hypothetical protein